MYSGTNDIEADIQQNERLIWYTLHKYLSTVPEGRRYGSGVKNYIMEMP